MKSILLKGPRKRKGEARLLSGGPPPPKGEGEKRTEGNFL